MPEKECREEFDKIMSSLTLDELIILGLMFCEIYDSEAHSIIQEKKGMINRPC